MTLNKIKLFFWSIILKHGILFYFYADNLQIYLPLKPNNPKTLYQIYLIILLKLFHIHLSTYLHVSNQQHIIGNCLAL